MPCGLARYNNALVTSILKITVSNNEILAIRCSASAQPRNSATKPDFNTDRDQAFIGEVAEKLKARRWGQLADCVPPVARHRSGIPTNPVLGFVGGGPGSPQIRFPIHGVGSRLLSYDHHRDVAIDRRKTYSLTDG